jgi:hypothetical protein
MTCGDGAEPLDSGARKASPRSEAGSRARSPWPARVRVLPSAASWCLDTCEVTRQNPRGHQMASLRNVATVGTRRFAGTLAAFLGTVGSRCIRPEFEWPLCRRASLPRAVREVWKVVVEVNVDCLDRLLDGSGSDGRSRSRSDGGSVALGRPQCGSCLLEKLFGLSQPLIVFHTRLLWFCSVR